MANFIGSRSEWRGKRKQASPVGSFPANLFGLRDMHGNVYEWIEDCWHENYELAPDDASAGLEECGGDSSRRVLRGGSWFTVQANARSANRGSSDPALRTDNIGFRVLCSFPMK